VACHKETPPDPSAVTSPVASKASPVVAAPVVTLSDRISRPAAPRVVAIGDLHGDMESTRRALRLAGAIDRSDAWIGGNLVVVQTGDEVDRGDDDRIIVDFFEKLRASAKAAGGEVIAMSGNHELMNVVLDFRYVTPGAYTAFADVKPSAPFLQDMVGQFPEKQRGRVAAFAPGGPYARLFADRPIVMRVGTTVFTHGGLLARHVSYGLDRMNDETHEFFQGKSGRPPPAVSAEDSPLWLRTYSLDPTPGECASLEKTLASVGARRLVVGHTVQQKGITTACGDRVWRIDTGMSRFYGGPIRVLEIRGDTFTELKENG
jgi:hypothetical protein